MVAFVPTDTECRGILGPAPCDLKALAAEYAGWDEPVQDTINSLDETFRWGIYDRAPLPDIGRRAASRSWAMRHVPWSPHVGQGAGQSIEDAITLAVLLEGCTAVDVAGRLKLDEALRLARTSRVQALARAAGKLYRSEHENPSEKAERLREWSCAGKVGIRARCGGSRPGCSIEVWPVSKVDRIEKERERGHVSRSSFRKQMVDRVRRDVVDAGGSRAGHSVHIQACSSNR